MAGVFMYKPTNIGGDMASTARVPEAEITGIYGGLLKMGMRKMIGEVPESAGVMWQNPRVFKDMLGFGRKVEKWGEIDPLLGTLAAMAAASHIGCSFCLDFHYFMAHDKSLDETKAREVPRWRESMAFTPLERQVMEYAEAISQTPPAVTDELSAELLEQLGAPALLELTAKVGVMNLTARTNVALGIRSQEFAASCGLPPLAAPSAHAGDSADVGSSA
jgi:AhpD family alkylhydroperoxidase